MAIILLVIFFVFSPLLILHLCHKYRFVNKIGAIVIAYAVGFVMANIGILPSMGEYLNSYLLLNKDAKLEDILALYQSDLISQTDVFAFEVAKISNLIMTIIIPIAIPLLLFSLDVRKWFQIAGKTMLSMLFALIAAISTVVGGYFIFRHQGIFELWDVSGMLFGLYSGGTPNLASIKVALNADQTNYMVIATYDILIGALHLLFVMTIAQKVFLMFLPKYKFIDTASAHIGEFDGIDPYWGMLQKRLALPLLKAFGVSVLIFAVAGGVSFLVPESSQMAVVILLITTLGIGASLIPAINKIEKSFELGMYLILIFCMVIASMADLSRINFASLMIAAYVTIVIFGSLIIQAVLSKIFKIDADTFIITSTAFICSPPFVPIVAGALKNREVIFSGLTVGIIGYAIANYFGVFISWFLEKFFA